MIIRIFVVLLIAFGLGVSMIWCTKEQRKKSVVSWIGLVVALLLACFEIDYVPAALAVAALFYFLWSSVLDQRAELAKKELAIAQKEAELANQRTDIMISQIQPHFIFNVLNTICFFCRKDPKTAEYATMTFSRYLRGNIDSLGSREMVLFSKELDHVNNYLDLEKLRFRDKFRVDYNIGSDAFYIPYLTVQPLVENAIKHGFNGLVSDGIITISTWENDEAFFIEVKDNGKGFDPKAKEADDYHKPVGIENVRGRLASMCKGSLDIVSAPGEGTTVTITVPREGQQ